MIGISFCMDPYEASGPPVLRIPNVKNGHLVLDDLKFAESGKAVSSETPIEPADFIIIRTNGSRDLVGTGALVEKKPERPHYFASYLIRYRLISETFNPAWLNVIWPAPSIRKRVLAMSASTTGQYNVSLGNLNDLEIPLPPLSEQHRIVAEVNCRLSALARIEEQVKAALQQTQQLRASLFHRAMSGELVTQNRSEEPASHLLSRIRMLKAQLAKQPKFRSVRNVPSKRNDSNMPNVSTPDLAQIPQDYLAEIIRKKKVKHICAKLLWEESGLGIDEFYAQLKREMGKTIREHGDDRTLELIP